MISGLQYVYVTYEGCSTKFSVSFNGRSDVRGIKLAQKPYNVIYDQGSRLDASGLVVNAVAQDLSVVEQIPESELKLMGFRNDAPGVVSVTVSYLDYYTTSFSVRITENKLISGITRTKPNKLVYSIGEEFDPTGMTVSVKSYDATTEVVDLSLVSVSGFENNTPGVKNVTVSYKGYTSSFSVRVV